MSVPPLLPAGAYSFCDKHKNHKVPVQTVEGLRYKIDGSQSNETLRWAMTFCTPLREDDEGLDQGDVSSGGTNCTDAGKVPFDGLVNGIGISQVTGICDSAWAKPKVPRYCYKKDIKDHPEACHFEYAQVEQGVEGDSGQFLFDISCDWNSFNLQADNDGVVEVTAFTRPYVYKFTGKWKAACENFTRWDVPPIYHPPSGAAGNSPAASEDPEGVFGTVIIILILVFAVLYVIGGVVYNKVKGAPGNHPHGEFWSTVPESFINGHRFVKAKLTGSKDYETINSEEAGSSTM